MAIWLTDYVEMCIQLAFGTGVLTVRDGLPLRRV